MERPTATDLFTAERVASARPARPTQLPPTPWRYTLTTKLVAALLDVAQLSGELRAARLSYYERNRLEVAARRKRIGHLARVGADARVDAVLTNAIVRPSDEPIARRVRHAAIILDAIAFQARTRTGSTAPLCAAYLRVLGGDPDRTTRSWFRLAGVEKRLLLTLERADVEVPSGVRALYEWIEQDAFVREQPVLRAATLWWGLSLLYPALAGAEVIAEWELRSGGYDPAGLVVLALARDVLGRVLLSRSPSEFLETDHSGELTAWFGAFAGGLSASFRRTLESLRRVQDREDRLPWAVVAPPDALERSVFEIVESRGTLGSAAILEALTAPKPPLRTLQRRLNKLVRDGLLARYGARKNALYAIPGVASEDR